MTTHLRRFGAITVAAVLAVGLTACSNNDGGTPNASGTAAASKTATPSATATGSATGTATPEPSTIVDPKTGEVDWCKTAKDLKPFTGQAAETFGADNVMKAYCFAGNFAINNGFTSLMEEGKHEVGEFAFLKEYLTPAVYSGLLDSARKGDEAAATDINGLTGFQLESKEYQFDEDLPYVTKAKVGIANTTVDTTSGTPRLAMRFHVTGDLMYRRTADNKVVAFPYDKDTTFWMVPNGDAGKPWLIDAYSGKVSGGEVRVVK